MPSLIDCLELAGKLFQKDEEDALKRDAKALQKEGMSQQEAEKQAVRNQIEDGLKTLRDIHQQAGIKPPAVENLVPSPTQQENAIQIESPTEEVLRDEIQGTGEIVELQGVEQQNQPEEVAQASEEIAPKDANLGPGAANALEFALMPKRTTSTKNAVTNAERAARGDLEVLKEAIQTNEDTFQMALDRMDANENIGQEIVNGLLSGTKQEVSEVDEAILLHEKVRLMNERTMEEDRILDPYTSEEEKDAARTRWKDAETKISLVDQATRKSGTIWGRLGQFRQRLLRDDYTFEAMERKARVSKDRPLTAEESEEIRKQSERIAELETQLETATAQAIEKDAEKTSKKDFEQTKREAAKQSAESKRKRLNLDTATQRDRLIEAIRNQAAEGNKVQDLRVFIQKLALNLVRSGTKDRDTLIDQVQTILSEIYPDIQRSQTRDLISGYGDFKPLDQEPAKVTLRGLKGEMQQIGKIEDMMAKTAPRKTGMERRTPTDEERRLIKEVNELKKKAGFEVTDPATQLKTALAAIKTRLQNEIRDLETAIATKEPLVKKDGSIQYDAEAEALRKQRDQKKEEYAQIFPKEPLTDEQRIAQIDKSLDRSIEQLQADLKAGRLYPGAPKKYSTPELEAKRSRLQALREERQNIRNLDTAVIEQKKEADLLKAIERAQQILPDKPTGVSTVDTERVAQLKAQLEEIRKAKAESPEAQHKKIDQAIETVKKSIADYDKRLQDSDFAPKATKEAPTSPELEALRAERDSMRELFRQLREAEKPKKTAEEIRLQSYKTRTANRIAELQEKVLAGDFEKKEIPSLVLDKEALDLSYKLNEAQRDFNRARLNDRLARRPAWQKTLEGGRDTLNTLRAVQTSIDLSAILRQGGIISLAHPVRSAKILPAMFKSMASQKQEYAIDKEIRRRPNFELYKKSGLYINDPYDPDLTKMEEQYQTRWLDLIPLSEDKGILGTPKRLGQFATNVATGPVRASQRAFNTFLNRLRADSFDSMVKGMRDSDGRVDPETAKAIANYINITTGRGHLAGGGKGGVSFNALFFAPRLAISRLEYLAAQPLWFGTRASRKKIAIEYARTLGTLATMLTLAAIAGADIEKDPRSSDFLKIKDGNTRVDFLAGMQQWLVLLTRLLSGETKTGGGKIAPLREHRTFSAGFRYDPEQKVGPFRSTGKVAGNFLRSKLAPAPGSVVDTLFGKNVIGEEIGPTDAIARLAIPMSIGSIVEVMEEQGIPKGTAYSLLSIMGAGVNTYDQTNPTK